MFIRSLELERYGAFTNRRVDFGAGSLTLVIGPNEAGKSTTLEAMSDVLWGIPTSSRQAFLHGRPALAVKAEIDVEGTGPTAVVRRANGLYQLGTGATVSEVWLTPQDSGRRWREAFGLAHTELREGGRLLCAGRGDLAELVFTARSGRTVRELLAGMEATAAKLYKEHRGNKSVEVRQALAEYEDLRRQVTEATAAAPQVRLAREAVQQARTDVERAQRAVAGARVALQRAEQRQRAAAHARKLAGVLSRAAELRATGPVLDVDQLARHEQLGKGLAAAEDAIAEIAGEVQRREQARASLVVDGAVLADAEQIQGLHLEAEARTGDAARARDLAARAAELDRRVAALLAELGDVPAEREVSDHLASMRVAADRVAQLGALAEELQEFRRQLATKADALRSAEQRLAEAGDHLLDVDADAVAAVREAAEAIATTGSAADQQRRAWQSRADEALRRDEALRLAGLPSGAPVPAAIPSAGQVTEAAERLAGARASVQGAGREVERLRAAIADTTAQIEAAQSAELPNREALATARGARDALIEDLVSARTHGRPAADPAELGGQLRQAVAHADTVADLLLTHADEAARLAELGKTLGDQQADLDRALGEAAECAARVEAVTWRWAELWPAFETAVPSPSEAGDVRRHLEEARAAEERRTAAADLAESLQDQVSAQAATLAAALARAGRPRPDTDLDALVEAARALLAADDDRRVQRARRDELARTEAHHRWESDSAAAAYAATQDRWRAALRVAGVPEDLDAPAWFRRRDLLAQAQSVDAQAADAGREAQEAAAASAAFRDAVTALAGRHAIPDDDPEAAIGLLAQRRDLALADRRAADELDGQLREFARRRDEEDAGRAEALRGLDELRLAVGAADLIELAEVVERSTCVAELADDEERLTGLVRAAAPDLEVLALVEECAATEREVLAAACDSVRDEHDAAEQAQQAALELQADARRRERELTSGPGAAELHARAQEQLAVLRERVERYVVARVQADVLRAELEAYERRHASPLLDEAGEILQRLTGGRYVALGVVDRGESRGLEVVGADEERRTPDQLSEGTADQVFLALRLAGIAAQQRDRSAAGVPSLPVVLDDVLMTFDDERTAAALRVLAELSRQWQVIVLSHHAHIASLARELGCAELTVAQLQTPVEMAGNRSADDIRRRARTVTVQATSARSSAPASSAVQLPAPRREGAGPGAVREWARAHGYDVAERGRISADITEAYERAHR
ncbi:AAA family ATPase [Trujillonella humicola]|uniref:AAA family ATPase n=1 Tax=Trujillonella humicola TaxID=3383699 RepID=UPI0039064B34